ncbi:HVO_A0556 family zinc finger protein [Natronolimnobius sp. AArcel1]|uniref:HVO_A0556 family zinc finger protein n=1 Tax=Natronolimnobius sp. AArcel1 TaxID=1679093 RepID=UPI00272DC8F2|nr:HVO_A0556 family zinc finger protein [Natronolimnobius sp. AArcel1]
MRQLTENQSSAHSVLDALEGGVCSFCGDGELVRNTYKDNDAVVCSNCHTPGAQNW